MKYFKFIAIPIIAFVISITISCERDDICAEATPTTPRLIIDFYDISIQEDSKNVFDLRIVGADKDDEDYLTSEVDGVDNIYDGSNNFSQITLPLKTEDSDTGEVASSTQYILTQDYSYDDNDTPDDTDDDIYEGNSDTITINYSTKLVFVSRACGYKTIFENVTISIVNDGDNWISSRESINDNQSVEDETTTHFNFFH
ncbi:MAG: DUF6452 family protein [Algibacter sp.]